jgi:hypothetical protein
VAVGGDDGGLELELELELGEAGAEEPELAVEELGEAGPEGL